MPVYKRKNTSGKTVWFYKFQPPGATRNAPPIREFGFVTKQEAVDAEVARRIEEQKKLDLKKAGAAGVAAAMPTTLEMLLAEFMKQHAEEELSPTTVEGYHRMIEYLSPELLVMSLWAWKPVGRGLRRTVRSATRVLRFLHTHTVAKFGIRFIPRIVALLVWWDTGNRKPLSLDTATRRGDK